MKTEDEKLDAALREFCSMAGLYYRDKAKAQKTPDKPYEPLPAAMDGLRVLAEAVRDACAIQAYAATQYIIMSPENRDTIISAIKDSDLSSIVAAITAKKCGGV